LVPLALVLMAVGGEPKAGAQDRSGSPGPGSPGRDSSSPKNKEIGPWIRPSGKKDSEPVWGIQGGIAVGLWPTPGPRGLLRIYTPYLGQPRLRMINFIAVEPIVGDARGLSELEPSAMDKTAGKAMWSDNELDLTLTRPRTGTPASGKVISLEGTQALTVFLHVEAFNNGARRIVQITLRRDRPHEIGFNVFAARQSAPMRSCILTATMGTTLVCASCGSTTRRSTPAPCGENSRPTVGALLRHGPGQASVC
jgi:hypothetical protein